MTKQVCWWTLDDDTTAWDTGCGETFLFNDGGPRENKARFCPYCGGSLKIDKEDADRMREMQWEEESGSGVCEGRKRSRR